MRQLQRTFEHKKKTGAIYIAAYPSLGLRIARQRVNNEKAHVCEICINRCPALSDKHIGDVYTSHVDALCVALPPLTKVAKFRGEDNDVCSVFLIKNRRQSTIVASIPSQR